LPPSTKLRATHHVLIGLTLLWFFTVSLPILVLAKVCGLVADVRLLPDVVVVADISARGARFWKWSTTIGRLILIHPVVYERDGYERILAHERVHVRQHEDLCFIAWQLSLFFSPLGLGFWWAGLLLWWSAGLWQLLMYLSAAMRYGAENAYGEAEHERAAYAQTDGIQPWLTRHEAKRGRLS